MKIIEAIGSLPLIIGKQGENNATKIVFDLSALIKLYGAGTVQLLAQRAQDETPYPCVITQVGDKAEWVISNADTQYAGTGKCELHYYVGDTLAKTQIWQTVTECALSDVGTKPPEPEVSWVTDVLSAGISANEAANSALDFAHLAETSALSADNSALKAEKSQLAIENMTVEAHAVEGENPTVTKTTKDGVVNLDFGLVRGEKGTVPQWEYINSITTQSGDIVVSVTEDSNGQPFELDAVLILFKNPATAQEAGGVVTFLNNQVAAVISRSGQAAAGASFYHEFEKNPFWIFQASGNGTWNSANNSTANNPFWLGLCRTNLNVDKITSVALTISTAQNIAWQTGTQMEIYGKRGSAV